MCNNIQNFKYEFDSNYVTNNYKLYNENNNIIFKVKTIQNVKMIIRDKIIETDAINDIKYADLLCLYRISKLCF